jgi:predicted enzyme related to lactoylglutathione lyase
MNKHLGHFVHRELMTSDVDAARAFYSALLGWAWQAVPMDGMTYWTSTAGDHPVAGVMPLMDAPAPAWSTYLSVADVDAAAASVLANGGAQLVPPMDIPGIGRWACVADPQGAVFMLFTGASESPPPPDRPPLGTVCWETLNTTDVEAALQFYTAATPLTRAEFGGMAVLKAADGASVADVGPVAEGVPPHWLLHFAVADLGASRARLLELGGSVIVPEIDIPTVGKIGIVADPQGASFSLFQPA